MWYEEKLCQDGLETILGYGITCNRKNAEYCFKSGQDYWELAKLGETMIIKIKGRYL